MESHKTSDIMRFTSGCMLQLQVCKTFILQVGCKSYFEEGVGILRPDAIGLSAARSAICEAD